MKVEALKAFAVEQGVNKTLGKLWDDADYELMLLQTGDDLERAKDELADSLRWMGWETIATVSNCCQIFKNWLTL